jgi:hypothetical protein
VTDAALVCANHPDRATLLRCNRCEKPICTKCAILTPVGYRCRECVEGVRRGFDNARSVDYPVAAGVSATGTAVAVFLLQNLGFWALIVAPVVGGALAEGVRWAVGRRRAVRLPWTAVGGGALGILAAMALPWLGMLRLLDPELGFGIGSLAGTFLAGAIWQVIPGAVMLTALYYRLKGITL